MREGRWEAAAAAALVLGAALACNSGKSGGSGSSGAAPAAPAVAVQATQLFKDYEANEVSADEKYKGKRLRVLGQVQSIDKDAFDNIVVKLKTSNQFLPVHAKMGDGEKAKAAALAKDKQVSVECTGRGRIIGSPLLDDCALK